MNEFKKRPWFPQKTYGIGWGLPNTWQGWAVVLIYIFLSITGFLGLSDLSFQVPLFLSYFIMLTLVFIFVVWKKGAKPDQ